MSGLKQLKKKIENILLAPPVELIDTDGTIYEVAEWEAFSDRVYRSVETQEHVLTKRIGSANMDSAIEFLYTKCKLADNNITDEQLQEVTHELFHDLLGDLEKEKIIRKIPEIKRQEIRLVVDNTVEGFNDREKREEL